MTESRDSRHTHKDKLQAIERAMDQARQVGDESAADSSAIAASLSPSALPTEKGITRCPSCYARIELDSAVPTGPVTCASCNHGLQSVPDPELGTLIGPYKLLQKIGEGGMGSVYMAQQTEPVDRRVAIKIIKPGMDSREVIARFEAERQALAMMDHPNIARVLDAGTTDAGRPYFVMELVKGVPITKFCDAQRLSPGERLELFIPVCQAVQHAHQKGIIHRDLKPSNVLIALYDSQAVPKVIDFGVAKATAGSLTDKTMFTQLGQVVGTLEYMSPEQAQLNQLDIDTRSDIYSLGTIMYEILTGTTPFTSQRLRNAALDEVIRIIRDEEPPRPSTRISTTKNIANIAASRHVEPAKLSALVRGELDWIVMKAMEKDRTRRYETANGLAMDIRRYLDDEPVLACPPSAGYRLRKFAHKNRSWLTAAGLIAATLVAAAAISIVLAIQSTQQRDRAVRAEQTTNAALTREQDALRKERVARTDAQKAQQLAEDRADQNRLRLVRSFVDQGMRLVDDGDMMTALPWLVEALKLDDDERESVHRTRIASVLGNCPRMSHVWFQETAPRNLQTATNGPRVLVQGFSFARVVDVDTGQQIFASDSQDSVRCAAIGSQGRMLLLGIDNKSRLIEIDTEHQLLELEHASPVQFVDISPDGTHILVVYGDTGQVYSASSGEAVGAEFRHSAQIRQARFSQDGRMVVTAAGGRSLTGTNVLSRVWDAASGKLLHSIPGGVADLNPQGDRFAVGTIGGNTRIVDLATGDMVEQPMRQTADIAHVLFSSDGRHLVTSSFDGTARVWDAATGNSVCPPLVHAAAVQQATFSPNGLLVATASDDGTARVWEVQSGEPVCPWLQHQGAVQRVMFCHDGRRIITICEDKTCRLWDLARGQPDRPPVCNAFAFDATYSPDGSQLAVPDLSHFDSSRIWDVASGQALTTALGGSSDTRIRFDRSGQRLAIGGSWPGIRMWDVPSRKLLREFGHEQQGFLDFDFNPDGNLLVACPQDSNSVLIFDTGNGALVTELKHEQISRYASFRPNGRQVLTINRDRIARIWDVATGQILASFGEDKPMFSRGSWHPSKSRVLLLWGDHAVVWDVGSDQIITAPMQHNATVFFAEFDGEGNRVLTVSSDRTARVWDAETGAALTPPIMHGGATPGSGARPYGEFSSDGRLIATASSNETARIWDAANGQAVTPLLEHSDVVQFAGFRPDSQQIVTTCWDSEIRVWPVPHDPRPVETLAELAQLYGGTRIDADAGQLLLQAGAFRQLFQNLRDSQPEEFLCSTEEIRGWHFRRAAALTDIMLTSSAEPQIHEQLV
ncbi:MAG: protein kinase domain-containing protein, partial [Pirellulaceae bacterium]